jgi:hypothetical protein
MFQVKSFRLDSRCIGVNSTPEFLISPAFNRRDVYPVAEEEGVKI